MVAKIFAGFSIVICHSGKIQLPHLLQGFILVALSTVRLTKSNIISSMQTLGSLFFTRQDPISGSDDLFGHRPGRSNSVNTVGVKASVVKHVTIVKVRIQVIHWHLT